MRKRQAISWVDIKDWRAGIRKWGTCILLEKRGGGKLKTKKARIVPVKEIALVQSPCLDPPDVTGFMVT